MNKFYSKLSSLLLACTLLFSSFAKASTSHHNWYTSYSDTYACDAQTSCQLFVDHKNANCGYCGMHWSNPSGNGTTCTYSEMYLPSSPLYPGQVDQYYVENGPVECKKCDGPPATSSTLFSVRSDAPSPESLCWDSCKYNITGVEASVDSWFDSCPPIYFDCYHAVHYLKTDETCGNNTPNTEYANQNATDPLDTHSGCTAGEPGCTGQYCGTVNGDAVCVDGVKDGECASTVGGYIVCVDSPHSANINTGRPDADNNSVADDPYSYLGGDIPVQPGLGGPGASTGGVISVYPSTNNVVGGGAWDSGGHASGGGNGSCTGSNCGSGDGSNDGTMGKGNYGRDLDSVADFSTSFGLVKNELQSWISDTTFEDPSGTCPSTSFTLRGHVYSFSTTLCSAWDQVSSLISAVVMFVYSLVSFRIVWSA